MRLLHDPLTMDAIRRRDVEAVDIETLNRIQLEYLEMPDMKLTLPQAGRLWSLRLDVCHRALQLLVDRGFLVRSRDGGFLRRAR